ncbi:MAG: hypothetical protein PHP08_02150 [Candidatus Dojkabacteria bacterium]|nr:hypothetical protein [Candidatus Dojkabacteria bacterium]
MEIEYLYHASSNKNIDVLKPRQESVRDPKEGPVVFASQDKPYTSCFLTPTDSSWVKISKYTNISHLPIYLMVISDEKRFKELDKGGAIYYLSPNGFYLDKSKSLIEWTSKKDVTPIKKDVFDNSLDAMIDSGVVVYFCNKSIFSEIQSDPQNVIKTMNILKELESENEKRGSENPIHKYY